MALYVYVTCPDMETARKIGRITLEEHLVACCDIFPGYMEATFFWKGEFEGDTEIAMVLKTMEDRFDELNKRILELHPYETPCVIAMPIVAGNPDYLTWLHDSTRPARQA